MISNDEEENNSLVKQLISNLTGYKAAKDTQNALNTIQEFIDSDEGFVELNSMLSSGDADTK